MLQKLTIKNIALIDSVEIPFSKGLNVLSGETGAGKSVIIDSLNVVLGAKADKTLIKTGQTECSVVAEFDVCDNQTINAVYQELDFENEDILIISRKFTIDGKSSIKINGNTATVSMLRKFTSALVDVHGQSEHFNLLKVSNQLALLDKFGTDNLLELKKALKNEYSNYKAILEQLDNFGGDESQRLIRLDVLNYQINEITSANLQEDEEENLLLIKEKLNNQEKIMTALQCVNQGIGSEGGVEDVLGNILRTLSTISEFDSQYSELYNNLENVFSEINDIQSTSSSLIDDFEVSEYNPYQIEDRLEVIKNLKSKYGGSFEQINIFLDNAIEEKDKLENFSEKIAMLENQKEKSKKLLFDLYNKISDIRKQVASNFENNVVQELHSLGMPKAKFVISFENIPTFEQCKFDSSNGFDSVEFMFSANLGEPLKPLSMVISGGEMSRFMLSIKAQTSKHDEISTFIFDEIDAGISGNVAKIVAEKFAKIAVNTQIIAITHLPQISAMADNNLLIEKHETDIKTTTSVKVLDKNDKVQEIVRLVGGNSDSEIAVSHANEVINWANSFKKSL